MFKYYNKNSLSLVKRKILRYVNDLDYPSAMKYCC